jgi:adenosylmethionine-8-amino-7-oxononanoate aminotransferase
LRTVTLGHSHPAVVAALQRQLAELQFCPSVGYGRPATVAVDYAEALAARLPEGLRHVRFGNSGSQMVDAAVLLSRFVRHRLGEPERTAVLALRGGFHGSGGGPSALTDDAFLHAHTGPLIGDVHYVPCPGEQWTATSELTAAVEQALGEVGPERVTAVLIEPVLGRSVTIFPAAETQRLAALCRRHGIHLVFDEVSTGMGRVGSLTRAQQVDICPDLLVLSKGMTSGYVPVGCLAVSDEIFDGVFDVPMPGFPVGSTTDGHPLAMAAGLAVLETLDEGNILSQTRKMGEYLRDELRRLNEPRIADVRGIGLLNMVVLHRPDGTPWPFEDVERLRYLAEDRGVLLATHDSAVEISPPLVISQAECDTIVAVLAECLTENAR